MIVGIDVYYDTKSLSRPTLEKTKSLSRPTFIMFIRVYYSSQITNKKKMLGIELYPKRGTSPVRETWLSLAGKWSWGMASADHGTSS